MVIVFVKWQVIGKIHKVINIVYMRTEIFISSTQRELGEAEELQQMDGEAEEDQVIIKKGEQTGQEREKGRENTTGIDLGDTGTWQGKLKSINAHRRFLLSDIYVIKRQDLHEDSL